MNAILTTDARAIRTLTAPNGVTVVTRLTFAEALALTASRTSNFASDLVAKAHAGLTKNQAIYVYKIAEEVLASRAIDSAATAPVQQVAPFASIVSLFQTAKDKGAKRLRVRVSINGVKVVLTNAPETGRNAGGVYVKSAVKNEDHSVYFGVVTPDGEFKPGYDCNGDVLRTLETFAKDPVAAARAYGQKTGECCFCGRFLCDDTEGGSVEVGYGPVCATRFGLPHSAHGKVATE